MIARVITTKMKPGSADAAVRAMNESVVPDLDGLAGLEKFLVLIDSENNNTLTIAIYEDKAEMLKQEQSGWLQAKLVGLKELMAGRPKIDYFEVPIDW